MYLIVLFFKSYNFMVRLQQQNNRLNKNIGTQIFNLKTIM